MKQTTQNPLWKNTYAWGKKRNKNQWGKEQMETKKQTTMQGGEAGSGAVPVHGDGDCAFVVLPRGVQVGAREVSRIESPGRLQRKEVRWLRLG